MCRVLVKLYTLQFDVGSIHSRTIILFLVVAKDHLAGNIAQRVVIDSYTG